MDRHHDDPATAARIASKRPSPQFGMIDFAGEYKGWRVLLNPLGCYYGFIAAVGILTVFGIIMVFSSSSVDMVAAGSSPWAKALNKVGFSVVGLVLALVAAHCKGRTLKRLALPMYLVSVAVQVFTFFFGIDVGGNRGWLRIAGIQFQPAEFMKFTICLWFPLAMISMMRLKPGIRQSRKAWDLGDWGRTFGLYVLGLGSVLLGKDLGTALVIILIGLMAIVVSGFPMKYVGLVGIVAVVGVAILTVFSSNRMSRIMATYTGCTADNIDVCYQATHSNYALASGGLLGAGLGNSREKWNYLPAAHNDFIFAIIGEETGFVGAALVVLLFVVIMVSGGGGHADAQQVCQRRIAVLHDVDRWSGAHQHCRRRGDSPRDGRPVAVRLGWRFVDDLLPDGRRRMRLVDARPAADRGGAFARIAFAVSQSVI